MNLFELDSYKKFIKDRVAALKQINSQYTFDALASAMGIHKPYLSKVLNQKGNFTEDQLFRCAVFLKLNDLEKRYLELLFQENISEITDRKKQLSNELDKIRKTALKSSSLYSESESLDYNLENSDYFIDPHFALIHMHLLIPKYRENIELISNNLNISREQVFDYLELLHNMKVILKRGKEIQVLKEFIHLPENSKKIIAFRNLSKAKSVDKISRISSDAFLSMHVFFVADENGKNKIQKLFLEFLNESKKIADKSNSEDVFQLNFDLLKWS